MATTTAIPAPEITEKSAGRGKVFSALTSVAALAVLLQGLWAGIFLEHDGARDAASSWINVHARGGEVAIVFALAATAFAYLRMRARKDLWIGGAVLTILLILESYLGGLIKDQSKDALTAVHVPIAMALMGPMPGRLS